MCAAQLWKSRPFDQIRAGIQQYNASQETPAAAYLETFTPFWIETVRGYLANTHPPSRLEAVRGARKALHF